MPERATSHYWAGVPNWPAGGHPRLRAQAQVGQTEMHGDRVHGPSMPAADEQCSPLLLIIIIKSAVGILRLEDDECRPCRKRASV